MNDLVRLISKDYLPVQKIIKEKFYKNIKIGQKLLTSKNTDDMIGLVEFTVYLNGEQNEKEIYHFKRKYGDESGESDYIEDSDIVTYCVLVGDYGECIIIGYDKYTFFVDDLSTQFQSDEDIVDINIKTTLVDKTMFLKM
jgi:hypothetical protein